MQEVFEKIIEKLEEENSRLKRLRNNCIALSDSEVSAIENKAYNFSIEIVKQEAEKCKSIYMDGEYCWQSCWCTDRCGECNCLCNGDIDYYESYDAKNNLWISCSERLLDEAFGCLVTVMDCEPSTQTDFENILPHFVGYDGETWNDADGKEIPFEVIAWQKLPQPYQPKGE